MKNVQISYDLFLMLLRHHLLDDDTVELKKSINNALEKKLEALIKHDLYSTYKDKSLSPEEREKARQDYLNRIGMRDSFRWSAPPT
ncbi:complexin-2 [uncultured Lactobacillus sp.]|uniref:complexin-2 n=1 Tax=uncultured Lactobacillus sp. TaxID=153152 RepID=UPI00261B8E3E|nr:complexin-2 [uncultured Lactobacillus sp.]